MTKKVKTVKIGGGADYAKVNDRLKAFRSDHPRAKIVTTPSKQDDGMVMFRADILVDKADEHSAESTGHALQTKTGTKDFEKLETIAVGRALALLGYGADGEIASSEEMEEFENFKNEKLEKVRELVENAKTTDELKTIWEEHQGLGSVFAKIVTERKNEITSSKTK